MTKKSILTAVAAVALAGALTNSTNTTDAEAATKVMTYKEAGKRLYAAQQEAYLQFKDVKVSIKVKATKKNLYKVENKIQEYSDAENIAGRKSFTCGSYNTSGEIYDGKWHSDPKRFKYKGTVKNGYLNLQIIYQGKGGEKRVNTYGTPEYIFLNGECEKKIYDYLQTATKGKSQIERIAILQSFLSTGYGYGNDAAYGTRSDAYTVWNSCAEGGKAWLGLCSGAAKVFRRYAPYAGIKHFGVADWEYNEHESTAFRLEDGRLIIVDMNQSILNDWYHTDIMLEEVFHAAYFRVDWKSENLYLTINGVNYPLIGEYNDNEHEIDYYSPTFASIKERVNTEYNGDVEAFLGMTMKDWILSEYSPMSCFGANISIKDDGYTKKDVYKITWGGYYRNGKYMQEKKESVKVLQFGKNAGVVYSKYKY